MRRAILAKLLPPALLLAGCGGGGGSSTSATPVTVTILSTDGLDGTVGSAGDFGTTGPAVQTGDNSSTNEGFRAFVSFDLGVIPAGATVLSASLTLFQFQVQGAPYATMGPVVVDQVVYGNVLEAGAYTRSFPVNQAFATLSSSAALGAKTVDATAPLQNALASLNPQAQFRVRFAAESDNDFAFDLANFSSGSPASPVNERPSLTVTYRP